MYYTRRGEAGGGGTDILYWIHWQVSLEWGTFVGNALQTCCYVKSSRAPLKNIHEVRLLDKSSEYFYMQ